MSMKKGGMKPAVAAAILALTAVIGIGGGWMYVSHARKSFAAAEAEMPESAISTYLSKIKNGDYDGIYKDSLIVEPHLNSEKDYIAALSEIYGDVDTSSIQFAPESEEDSDLIYDLVYQKKEIARVHLKKTDEGVWLASTIFSGDHNYTIEVPTGLTLTVNGIDVADSYKTASAVTASNFSGMDDPSGAPVVDVYELDNLLGDPAITIAGDSSYGTLKDVMTNVIYVGRTATDADLANTFIRDIEICAQYPAQETSLGAVAGVSVTDSDWYSRIATLQNTWFTSHATSYFSNEKAFNIIQQSDDTMTGYVTFDYFASNSEVSRTWNCGYQLTFIKQNGTWKICGMRDDSKLNTAAQG